MNFRWLIVVPFALVGFAVGYIGTPDSAPAPSAMKTVSSESRTDAAPTSPEEHRERLGQRLRVSFAHASRLHRLHELTAFLDELPLVDLELIAKLIEELPREFRDEARRALALRLLALDPAVAAKFVESAPNSHGDLASFLAREWAKSEPEAALRWFAAQPSETPGINLSVEFLLRDLAKRDPRGMAELALSDPSHFNDGSCRAAFEAWGNVDARAAIARASALTNSRSRRVALTAAVQGWTGIAPEAALACFRQIDDPRLRGEVAGAIFCGLLKTDSDGALEVAHAMPEGRIRDTALVSIAEYFRLNKRPDESRQLLATIPFDFRNRAMASAYFGWSHDDVSAALGGLFQRMSLPSADADERRDIERFLIEEESMYLMQGSGKVARTLAESPGVRDELRARLVDAAAYRWAGENASQAKAWIETLPAGPVRESAFSAVGRGWAWSSSGEAAEWLATLPSSPDRNSAIAGFVTANLRRDPPATLEWLGKITDNAKRESALRAGWNHWRNNDRASAERWRDAAPGLTTADRVRLR